jgi:hypothetical protein
VATHGGKVDIVPGFVVPLVFRLEILPEIAPVALKTEIFFDVACVPEVIDGDRDFCFWDVSRGLKRARAWAGMLGCGQLVYVDIEFCVLGEGIIRGAVILVAFNPLDFQGTSEFSVKISDDREVVNVLRLFGWPCVSGCGEDDSVDCNFTVNEPLESASMAETPVSCDEGDEKERGSESSEFAPGGAADVNGTIHRARAVKKWDMGVCRYFPAEGTSPC